MKNFVAFILQTLGLRKGSKEADIVIQYKFLWGVVNEDLPAFGGERRGEADGECSVCLSMLREQEGTRRLPCRHLFHRVCVDRWLNFYQKTCPLCRIPVADGGLSWWKEELTDEMVIWFSSFHVAGF
ncbi:E3 ubiquitin-protein ligase RHA2A-like [Aristolochia californica]|uniref:E3 ubiquitin-protein ligase RHA2A-like n=1 Tax=Aristolochia californica TaxID=171875 RepID=UPI0035D78FAE